MSKKKIYVALQQFCEDDDSPMRVMRDAGFEVVLNKLGRRVKKEELPALLKDADAVLAGVEPYEDSLFSAVPQLKVISRCGIGCDAVDLEAAKRRNIAVLVTADEIAQPVAEMTMAMILALARNLHVHVADARAGQWKKHTGVLMSEWKIGLVGFGRIGRAAARLLTPFGCKILVSDPFLKTGEKFSGVEFVSFEDLLQNADVVSLHAARLPQDGPLMGKSEFSRMKKGSYLVNTARGYMVDEKALHESLTAGQLKGAALDVYEQEPYAGPLAALPNVICTPHVATLTKASRAAMELRAATNIIQFFQELAHVK